MPTLNIPPHTVPAGITEYGPVVVPARWNTARVTLNVANITQQTWFAILCSMDGGQTWFKIMRLDITGPGLDKQGNPAPASPFSVTFPDGVNAAQVKLIVDSPTAWSTVGGTVEVS